MGSLHQNATAPPVLVRLVSIDYYMAPPIPGLDVCFSYFEGVAIDMVPVVRIFGSTPAGQKACVHLHKAFPYLYVPYEDDLPGHPVQAASFLRRLAAALDKALALGAALGTAAGAGAGDAGAVVAKRQAVHNVQLVRGRPFYGYHAKERVFVKISLYNPQEIGKAATLLDSGAVLGRRFQPYESHLPYLLQIKMDLNLMGMGHVSLTRCTFRPPLPSTHPLTRHGWDADEAPCAPEGGAALGTGATSQPSSQHHHRGGSIPRFSLGTLGTSSAQGRGGEGGGEGLGRQGGDDNGHGHGQRSLPAHGGSSQPTGSLRLAVWTSMTVPGTTDSSTGGAVAAAAGGSAEGAVGGCMHGSDAADGRQLEAGATGVHTGLAADVARLITAPSNVCVRQELPRHSTCALELDTCIEDVMNRHQAIRAPLDAAHEDASLLQSLQPLWVEEAGRCGGAVPARPPSPPRDPRPLCAAVEAVRAELANIAATHAQQDAQEAAAAPAAHAQAAGADGPQPQGQHSDQQPYMPIAIAPENTGGVLLDAQVRPMSQPMPGAGASHGVMATPAPTLRAAGGADHAAAALGYDDGEWPASAEFVSWQRAATLRRVPDTPDTGLGRGAPRGLPGHGHAPSSVKDLPRAAQPHGMGGAAVGAEAMAAAADADVHAAPHHAALLHASVAANVMAGPGDDAVAAVLAMRQVPSHRQPRFDEQLASQGGGTWPEHTPGLAGPGSGMRGNSFETPARVTGFNMSRSTPCAAPALQQLPVQGPREGGMVAETPWAAPQPLGTTITGGALAGRVSDARPPLAPRPSLANTDLQLSTAPHAPYLGHTSSQGGVGSQHARGPSQQLPQAASVRLSQGLSQGLPAASLPFGLLTQLAAAAEAAATQMEPHELLAEDHAAVQQEGGSQKLSAVNVDPRGGPGPSHVPRSQPQVRAPTSVAVTPTGTQQVSATQGFTPDALSPLSQLSQPCPTPAPASQQRPSQAHGAPLSLEEQHALLRAYSQQLLHAYSQPPLSQQVPSHQPASQAPTHTPHASQPHHTPGLSSPYQGLDTPACSQPNSQFAPATVLPPLYSQHARDVQQDEGVWDARLLLGDTALEAAAVVGQEVHEGGMAWGANSDQAAGGGRCHPASYDVQAAVGAGIAPGLRAASEQPQHQHQHQHQGLGHMLVNEALATQALAARTALLAQRHARLRSQGAVGLQADDDGALGSGTPSPSSSLPSSPRSVGEGRAAGDEVEEDQDDGLHEAAVLSGSPSPTSSSSPVPEQDAAVEDEEPSGAHDGSQMQVDVRQESCAGVSERSLGGPRDMGEDELEADGSMEGVLQGSGMQALMEALASDSEDEDEGVSGRGAHADDGTEAGSGAGPAGAGRGGNDVRLPTNLYHHHPHQLLRTGSPDSKPSSAGRLPTDRTPKSTRRGPSTHSPDRTGDLHDGDGPEHEGIGGHSGSPGHVAAYTVEGVGSTAKRARVRGPQHTAPTPLSIRPLQSQPAATVWDAAGAPGQTGWDHVSDEPLLPFEEGEAVYDVEGAPLIVTEQHTQQQPAVTVKGTGRSLLAAAPGPECGVGSWGSGAESAEEMSGASLGSYEPDGGHEEAAYRATEVGVTKQQLPPAVQGPGGGPAQQNPPCDVMAAAGSPKPRQQRVWQAVPLVPQQVPAHNLVSHADFNHAGDMEDLIASPLTSRQIPGWGRYQPSPRPQSQPPFLPAAGMPPAPLAPSQLAARPAAQPLYPSPQQPPPVWPLPHQQLHHGQHHQPGSVLQGATERLAGVGAAASAPTHHAAALAAWQPTPWHLQQPPLQQQRGSVPAGQPTHAHGMPLAPSWQQQGWQQGISQQGTPAPQQPELQPQIPHPHIPQTDGAGDDTGDDEGEEDEGNEHVEGTREGAGNRAAPKANAAAVAVQGPAQGGAYSSGSGAGAGSRARLLLPGMRRKPPATVGVHRPFTLPLKPAAASAMSAPSGFAPDMAAPMTTGRGPPAANVVRASVQPAASIPGTFAGALAQEQAQLGQRVSGLTSLGPRRASGSMSRAVRNSTGAAPHVPTTNSNSTANPSSVRASGRSGLSLGPASTSRQGTATAPTSQGRSTAATDEAQAATAAAAGASDGASLGTVPADVQPNAPIARGRSGIVRLLPLARASSDGIGSIAAGVPAPRAPAAPALLGRHGSGGRLPAQPQARGAARARGVATNSPSGGPGAGAGAGNSKAVVAHVMPAAAVSFVQRAAGARAAGAAGGPGAAQLGAAGVPSDGLPTAAARKRRPASKRAMAMVAQAVAQEEEEEGQVARTRRTKKARIHQRGETPGGQPAKPPPSERAKQSVLTATGAGAVPTAAAAARTAPVSPVQLLQVPAAGAAALQPRWPDAHTTAGVSLQAYGPISISNMGQDEPATVVDVMKQAKRTPYVEDGSPGAQRADPSSSHTKLVLQHAATNLPVALSQQPPEALKQQPVTEPAATAPPPIQPSTTNSSVQPDNVPPPLPPVMTTQAGPQSGLVHSPTATPRPPQHSSHSTGAQPGSSGWVDPESLPVHPGPTTAPAPATSAPTLGEMCCLLPAAVGPIPSADTACALVATGVSTAGAAAAAASDGQAGAGVADSRQQSVPATASSPAVSPRHRSILGTLPAATCSARTSGSVDAGPPSVQPGVAGSLGPGGATPTATFSTQRHSPPSAPSVQLPRARVAEQVPSSPVPLMAATPSHPNLLAAPSRPSHTPDGDAAAAGTPTDSGGPAGARPDLQEPTPPSSVAPHMHHPTQRSSPVTLSAQQQQGHTPAAQSVRHLTVSPLFLTRQHCSTQEDEDDEVDLTDLPPTQPLDSTYGAVVEQEARPSGADREGVMMNTGGRQLEHQLAEAGDAGTLHLGQSNNLPGGPDTVKATSTDEVGLADALALGPASIAPLLTLLATPSSAAATGATVTTTAHATGPGTLHMELAATTDAVAQDLEPDLTSRQCLPDIQTQEPDVTAAASALAAAAGGSYTDMAAAQLLPTATPLAQPYSGHVPLGQLTGSPPQGPATGGTPQTWCVPETVVGSQPAGGWALRKPGPTPIPLRLLAELHMPVQAGPAPPPLPQSPHILLGDAGQPGAVQHIHLVALLDSSTAAEQPVQQVHMVDGGLQAGGSGVVKESSNGSAAGDGDVRMAPGVPTTTVNGSHQRHQGEAAELDGGRGTGKLPSGAGSGSQPALHAQVSAGAAHASPGLMPPQQHQRRMGGPRCIRHAGLLVFVPQAAPPTAAQLAASWHAHGLEECVHQDPFYGDASDVPARPTVFANREWRIPSAGTLPRFAAASATPGLARALGHVVHDTSDTTATGPHAVIGMGDAGGGAVATQVLHIPGAGNGTGANAGHWTSVHLTGPAVTAVGTAPDGDDRSAVALQAGPSPVERLAAAVARALGGAQAAATAATSLRDTAAARVALGRHRPRGLALLPHLPPPTYATVQAWVAARQGTAVPDAAARGSGASRAATAGPPQLVGAGPMAVGGMGGGRLLGSEPTESEGVAAAASLQGTPGALNTPAASGPQSLATPVERQLGGGAQAPGTVAGGTRGGWSGRLPGAAHDAAAVGSADFRPGASGSQGGGAWGAGTGQQALEGEAWLFRPPSPKYDERTSFFYTPAIHGVNTARLGASAARHTIGSSTPAAQVALARLTGSTQQAPTRALARHGEGQQGQHGSLPHAQARPPQGVGGGGAAAPSTGARPAANLLPAQQQHQQAALNPLLSAIQEDVAEGGSLDVGGVPLCAPPSPPPSPPPLPRPRVPADAADTRLQSQQGTHSSQEPPVFRGWLSQPRLPPSRGQATDATHERHETAPLAMTQPVTTTVPTHTAGGRTMASAGPVTAASGQQPSDNMAPAAAGRSQGAAGVVQPHSLPGVPGVRTSPDASGARQPAAPGPNLPAPSTGARTQAVLGTAGGGPAAPLSLISPVRGTSAAAARTPASQRGFKRAPQGEAPAGEQLTICAIEVVAETRGTLLPDPRLDALRCVVLVGWEDGDDPAGELAAGDGGRVFVTRVLMWDGASAGPLGQAQQQQQPRPVQPLAAMASEVVGKDVDAGQGQVPQLPPAPQQGYTSYRPGSMAQAFGAAVAGVPCAAGAAPGHPPPTLHSTAAVPVLPSAIAAAAPAAPATSGAVGGPNISGPAAAAAPDPQHVAGAGEGGGGGGGGSAAAPAGPAPLSPAWWKERTCQGAAPVLGAEQGVDALRGCRVEVFPDEASLLLGVVGAVRALDPDVLVGWEMQKGSLGYIVERAQHLGLDACRALSRVPGMPPTQWAGGAGRGASAPGVRERWRGEDEYGQHHASGLNITGRVLLNLWRIMKGEVKLFSYSFESCCAAVLRLRVPHVPPTQLAAWFRAGPAGGRWRAVRAAQRTARLSLLMLDSLDLVGRTSEMARVFGIDFFSVLTRGSQYRVESMLVRLAHSQNYLCPSPSREQVGGQPAMEAIPLVMEPESRLYTSPVVVLDFQSLYPSQVIAYNLCYSTCLGRPAHVRAGEVLNLGGGGDSTRTAAHDATRAGQPAGGGAEQQQQHAAGAREPPASVVQGIRLGATTGYYVPRGTLAPGGLLAADKLVITPNGVSYAPHTARQGVVPRLLREILDTRVMVKGGMKRAGGDRVLQRVLNARQFGLKMIANVTYGYTSAGFSGRMPFAELADSIVQAGRQTLENAVALVEGHPDWRARVVYGDTDSMFVLLPGRSRAEAFRIGAEIASAVTSANPRPVTLKLEKVYHPCILQTKKRYVGFAYEAPGQPRPVFDAKGIETVRRDACPAVVKLLEGTLRLLFTTRDLSQVKAYLTRQWAKIMGGRVSLQDFVFCKEVRLGTYSAAAAAPPPAAVVAGRAMAADPRAEPAFGERVSYVVVHGAPGARLVDQVVTPHALLESGGRLRLNGLYYITKQIIPALERVLSLVGADVRAWFAAMPRAVRMLPQKRPAAALGLTGPGALVAPAWVGGAGGRRMVGQARTAAGTAAGNRQEAAEEWEGAVEVMDLCEEEEAENEEGEPRLEDAHIPGTAAGTRSGLHSRPGSSTAVAVAAGSLQARGPAGLGLSTSLYREVQPGRGGRGGGSGPARAGARGAAAGTAAGGGQVRRGTAGNVFGHFGTGHSSSTIDQFYLSRHCAVCDELTHAGAPLCLRCAGQPQAACATLTARVARLERQYRHMLRICLHCGGGGGGAHAGVAAGAGPLPPSYLAQQQQQGGSGGMGGMGWEGVGAQLGMGAGGAGGVVCDSLDCGVYFERAKLAHEAGTLGRLLACAFEEQDE